MMTGLSEWPTWLFVAACGILNQFVKIFAYSIANKRIILSAIVQPHGLPSLPAAMMTSLLVLSTLRAGWHSGTASFALVFAVVVLHDLMKVRGAAQEQRLVVFQIVDSLAVPDPLRSRTAGFLDIKTHHPAHVLMGALVGCFFALAFGLGDG